MHARRLAVPLALLIAGCAQPQSGPPSTNTTSAQFAQLADKIAFLEQYVQFRRSYQQLDFCVQYSNNAGGTVPGPSEFDVRIVAVVPSAELNVWTSGLAKAVPPDAGWLTDVPTQIDYFGVKQWFQKGGLTVGIDPKKSVVVYRHLRI